MIVIEDLIFSPELWERDFVCNLEKCKGICCVEGDSGAPLEHDEVPKLMEFVEQLGEEYLSEEGLQVISEVGVWTKDQEGLKTPLLENGACAFIHTDELGMHSCGIEKAYREGKTEFKKPISCHLYPIRVEEFGQFKAVNYERWDICSAACSLGKELKVPVYEFTKEALIRKFGEEKYQMLVQTIQDRMGS